MLHSLFLGFPEVWSCSLPTYTLHMAAVPATLEKLVAFVRVDHAPPLQYSVLVLCLHAY